MNKLSSKQPAYSLIFAFLVMTVIMIIATTTIENTNNKVAYFTEMEGSAQAMLAAQSAAEQGILAMKDYNAGHSIGLTSDAFQVDENSDGVYETWGDYTVYSNAQENSTDASGYYYTPIPGTGTAAKEDACTVSDSDHDGDFDNDKDVDDPCNWNKLMYGDTVTIPLYTDDGSGNILTPADFSNFTGWYLKVRTPCSVGEPDDPTCTTRFEFDGDGSDSITDPTDDDDAVVLWQLIGEDESGNSINLIPSATEYTSGFNTKKCRTVSGSCPILNTEIYESLIEAATDNIVLSGANTVPYTELYQICTETHPDYTNGLSTLSLQLNIVQPLIDNNGSSIPYLEWQLSENGSQAFADTKAVVIGEGYHQGKNGIFYYPYVVTRSTTGDSTNVYTLSN